MNERKDAESLADHPLFRALVLMGAGLAIGCGGVACRRQLHHPSRGRCHEPRRCRKLQRRLCRNLRCEWGNAMSIAQ